ncbi:MAG: hypothetical protein JSV98_10015 [candidate division WOR-3 bacterium]|nr:MAG: hypothetical protein JSV98_10015 [candidate division WOR-3 bacterium]
MSRDSWFTKFLELDWLKRPHVFLLSFMFILVRFPMLFLGFGLDPDAWRIANSAYDLRYHFEYHASRFPGYPLPEITNSLLINFGWVATNGLTMMLSLISVLAFAYLLKENKTDKKGLLTLTYAFTPLLWINSTNSMDYMWGLSLLIFTWFFLARQRFIAGGVMMGLAMSARPQCMIFLIPFVFLLVKNGVRKEHITQFVIASLILPIIFFLPVYLTYGFGFIHRYPPRTTPLQIGYGAIKYFGLPALVTLILIIVTSPKNLWSMIRKPAHDDTFILLSLAAAFLSFAAAPYHFEYLIPLVPFGYIFIARMNRKSLLIPFCFLVLLHGSLSFLSIKHTGKGRVGFRAADHGAVVENIMARRQQIADARKITTSDVKIHSVILSGPWLPVIAYLDNDISSVEGTKKLYDSNRQEQGVWNFKRDIWYRYLIDPHELSQLCADDFTVYYVSGVREYTLEVYGYDLYESGALLLEK